MVSSLLGVCALGLVPCLQEVAGASEQWADESRDEVLEMVKAELGAELTSEPSQITAEAGEEGGWEGEEEVEEGGKEEEEDDEELEQLKARLAAAGVLTDGEEEWDEDELDELFDKFGTTVISSPDLPSPDSDVEPQQGSGHGTAAGPGAGLAAEAAAGAVVAGAGAGAAGAAAAGGWVRKAPGEEPPTDEQSEGLAVALAVAASDTKAGNIRVLDVRPLIYWTQYFVVATAFSRPQMDAMAKRMSDLAEGQFKRSLSASERMTPGPWTLLDYGDVVVHLFAPRERERYAIEEFYANAREVPLPFVQEERSPY